MRGQTNLPDGLQTHHSVSLPVDLLGQIIREMTEVKTVLEDRVLPCGRV
jgi:hypothetical protein